MSTLLREAPPAASAFTRPEPQAPAAPQRTAGAPPDTDRPERLASLDAYRGFIMLFMASSGLMLPRLAKAFPDNAFLGFLGFHTDHVAWIGGSLWDMIQPSFMFMVGVAIPYSYAARKARNQSDARILLHTAWRALLLVLLGVFLASNWESQTSWVFPNVLAQIGLGYFFVMLLRGRGLAVQSIALAVILVGYWLFFLLGPRAGVYTVFETLAQLPEWTVLPGWFSAWDKHLNPAAAFDQWFLNLFPRREPYIYNSGGYHTLNFVPSMATMIFGLMAGELLRRRIDAWLKFWVLVGAGVAFVALGWLAGETVCPIVKRIWTPSWAVYSTGWTLLMLAAFYGVIDLGSRRAWSFPLIVVGMNSIAMYMMSQLMKGWIGNTLRIHLGAPLWYLEQLWLPGFAAQTDAVKAVAAVATSAGALLVMWLICLWMYRRKIFLKI